MGHVIQAESHTVELPFVHAAEQDPAVLELWDQPRQDWTMPLHYRSKTGHPVVAHHTPDFFELRQDAAGWVECKPQERLLVLAAEQPHRYCVDERGQWWCPPGQAYATQLGLTYRVFSSAEINWTAQRNWAYLTDYFDGSCPTVDHETLRRVLSVVAHEPGIRLAQLQERLSGLVSADDINILIATARLFVDLGIYALAEPAYVPVFRDPEMAAAHVIMTMPAARLDVGLPRRLTVEEGVAVRWDGRPWTIGAVTDTHTTLVSEQGAPVQLLTAVFDRYIGEGQIQGMGETIEQGLTEEGRTLVANASIEDQAQANQRYAVLQPHLTAGLSLDSCGPGIPRSTKFAWAKRWRDAEKRYGHGYLGLLDRPRAPQPHRVLSEAMVALLHAILDAHYATYQHKKKRRAFEAFLHACSAAGYPEIGERTFYREAARYLTAYEATRARAGRRAAYAYQQPNQATAPAQARHGDRPWELAHIDHTEVDLELLSSRTGRALGRAWVTLLIDAYSRRILALFLTYAPPSYASCLMVLRLCVQRWGRLPRTMVVDGGPEFHSTYFETLLAWYKVTLKTRPPAEPRYGSICERIFGTANTTFIHALLGNTQVMKNVRQVTHVVNPKTRARWTLGDLYTWLCEWAYEVYETISHPALGQSPRDSYRNAEERSGSRAHVRIPYDSEFIIRTLPTTRKGTARVQPGHGVKINNILYWCQAFNDAEVEGTAVAVRYDPFDVGVSYAFVRGHWIECRSDYYALLRGRSERELMLIGAELRKTQRDHAAGYKVTAKQLAAFHARIEEHEGIALQHERDTELRVVLTLVQGGRDAPGGGTVCPEGVARPGAPAGETKPAPVPKLLPRLP
jgi:putative transposase